MALTFYGLSTCDTCRKAVKALSGRDIHIVDIRDDGIPEAALASWLASDGPEALVNRRSTTWRGLSEADRAEAMTVEGAARLIRANPTLMKRPVIVSEHRVTIGWSEAVRSALGL